MAKRIRVVRVLEYSYDSVEAMEADMQCWEVQGVRRFSSRLAIRSSTFPLEVLEEEEPPELVEEEETG